MGDHFYTISEPERDSALARSGYRFEGIACYVAASPTQGSIPLFRLFNHDNGDHFYTTSAPERNRAVASAGYQNEGVACYVRGSSGNQAVPFYRLYNGDSGDHFYTTSKTEADSAAANDDYQAEGVACYVFTSNAAGLVPLYRLYKPGHDFWDDIADALSDAVDGVVGAFTTVFGPVITTAEGLIGGALNALGGILRGSICEIPYLGPSVCTAWDGVLTAGWAVMSLPDVLGGLIGVHPEKRMTLCVIIQLDEEGSTVADYKYALEAIQYAIDVFKNKANVRILSVGPFVYSSPFSDPPAASRDYISIESTPSGPETLDVGCGASDLLSQIETTPGQVFTAKMIRECFWGNARSVVGYGAPVVTFAVRDFKDGRHTGCSAGPLNDYVTVVLRNTTKLRTLPHELGHACNLWHYDDIDNLMTPGEGGGVGVDLSNVQVALLRASRHVTYF